MNPVRIAEVMTADVLSVEPSLSFADVVARMDERKLSCVPVAEDGKPVGVISERDVLRSARQAAEGAPFPETAGDAMSGPAITIPCHAGVEEAISVVNLRRIRRLVVVDGEGRLAGLVTQSDLVAAQTLALARERDLLEERVRARTHELEALSRKFEQLSLSDPMLGIGNRRAMENELDRLAELASRYHRHYSVLLFDIDHFKKYNDHYGHPVADGVLRQVSSAASTALRASDTIFRYGGEEFLVALPETDLEGAATTGERIRAMIEALAIPHELADSGVVSVSVGCATEPPDHPAPGWATRVNQADAALYRAKQGGRNRVACHDAIAGA